MDDAAARVPAPVRLNDLWVVPGMEGVLRSAGLDSLDAVFEAHAARDLDKPGLEPWRQRVRIDIDTPAGQRTLFIKRYLRPPRSARRRVRRSGSGARSMAGVEWSWTRRLRAIGLAVPDAVAFGERFQGHREERSAVIVSAVPGDALERLFGTPGALDKAIVRELLIEAAELIGTFHRYGYVHRDLYTSHLFCDPHAPPGRRLHLIDLQRVFRPSWRRLRWIVKDLAALNYSTPSRWVGTAGRLRFLRRYRAVSGLDVSERVLAYRIVGKTQAVARHDERRMRRLAQGRIA